MHGPIQQEGLRTGSKDPNVECCATTSPTSGGTDSKLAQSEFQPMRGAGPLCAAPQASCLVHVNACGFPLILKSSAQDGFVSTRALARITSVSQHARL